jgi:hypothetical protein
VDLYIHSPIRLNGVVLILLSTGTTLPFLSFYRLASKVTFALNSLFFFSYFLVSLFFGALTRNDSVAGKRSNNIAVTFLPRFHLELQKDVSLFYNSSL